MTFHECHHHHHHRLLFSDERDCKAVLFEDGWQANLPVPSDSPSSSHLELLVSTAGTHRFSGGELSTLFDLDVLLGSVTEALGHILDVSDYVHAG